MYLQFLRFSNLILKIKNWTENEGTMKCLLPFHLWQLMCWNYYCALFTQLYLQWLLNSNNLRNCRCLLNGLSASIFSTVYWIHRYHWFKAHSGERWEYYHGSRIFSSQCKKFYFLNSTTQFVVSYLYYLIINLSHCFISRWICLPPVSWGMPHTAAFGRRKGWLR